MNGASGTRTRSNANGESMIVVFITLHRNLERLSEGDILSQITELVYEELRNQYKLEKQRWEELNDKASTLFGFSGVIDTIVFGVFMLVISNEESRKLILNSERSYLICSLIVTGFFVYILATMIFLWSFRVKKHAPAPYIEDESVMDVLLAGGEEFPKIREIFSRQYLNGYKQNHEKVKEMYDQLFIGTLLLFLAVILSFTIAVVILLGVYENVSM